MAGVALQQVRKVYANGHVAVHGASFEVADGELLVLVGPSGCGKSTLLRMVAGLEPITSGTLRIGDRVVNDVAPKDRDIAMVFQSYALYPHMTVAQNLGFALQMRGLDRARRDAQVREAAALLELEGVLDRLPAQLSGGQRQRVALGRALVRTPQVFLLDEPLSNLDARLRASTRVEIARLHRRLGTTMLYVTHDQVEAMTLGQRIAVLHEGRIQQIDTPMALYERPANLFVATFLGSPAMNVLRGRLVRDDGLALVLHPGADGDGAAPLRVPLAALDVPDDWLGRDVAVGIRPEHLQPERVAPDPAASGFAPRLEVLEPVGSDTYAHLRLGPHPLVARFAPETPLPSPGGTLPLRLAPQHLHVFDGTSGQRLPA
jgi:multiple sugar transport system ATP-binding protein